MVREVVVGDREPPPLVGRAYAEQMRPLDVCSRNDHVFSTYYVKNCHVLSDMQL